jgi:hypothetical protein
VKLQKNPKASAVRWNLGNIKGVQENTQRLCSPLYIISRDKWNRDRPNKPRGNWLWQEERKDARGGIYAPTRGAHRGAHRVHYRLSTIDSPKRHSTDRVTLLLNFEIVHHSQDDMPVEISDAEFYSEWLRAKIYVYVRKLWKKLYKIKFLLASNLNNCHFLTICLHFIVYYKYFERRKVSLGVF